MQMLRLLGKLGSRLPRLKMKEWEAIFECLDFFMVVQEGKAPSFVSFDWAKFREILMLFDKIED